MGKYKHNPLKTVQILIVAIFLAQNFIFPQSASACTCLDFNPTFARNYKDTDAAFFGEVERISNPSLSIPKSLRRFTTYLDPSTVRYLDLDHVTVNVSQSWKGVTSKNQVILTDRTNCSTQFIVGENYLIYAYENEGDFYAQGICGRTVHEDNFYISQDLKILNSYESLELKESILLELILIMALVMFIMVSVLFVIYTLYFRSHQPKQYTYWE